MMTPLEEAQVVLDTYKGWLDQGNPWIPGLYFQNNPGLGQHILQALQEFVRLRQVEENARSAERVSLSNDPNWRPSSVAPVLTGSKEWVDGTDDDQGEARPS